MSEEEPGCEELGFIVNRYTFWGDHSDISLFLSFLKEVGLLLKNNLLPFKWATLKDKNLFAFKWATLKENNSFSFKSYSEKLFLRPLK